MRGTGAMLSVMLCGALLSGCTGGAEPGTAEPTAGATASSARPAGSASCTVPGLEASVSVVSGGVGARVLDSRSVTLPPGGSRRVKVGPRAPRELEAVKIEVTPGGGPVPDAVRRAVLEAVGARSVEDRVTLASISQELRNRSETTGTYVAYIALRQRTGQWSASRCGDPVRGTFRILDRPRAGTLACGRRTAEPRWLVPTLTAQRC